MPDQQLVFTGVRGGGLANQGHALFDMTYEGGNIDIVMPVEALPALAALALTAYAEHATTSGNAGGFPAESIDVTPIADGWTVLRFGIGPGSVQIALDQGQVGELRSLLPGKPQTKP